MYKLVAIDLDRTALNSDGVMPDENREALAALAAAGVRVVLASGRAVGAITPFSAALALDTADDYMVAFNGAVIARGTGEMIRSTMLPPEAGSRVLEYARAANLLVVTYDPVNVVAAPRSDADRQRLQRYARWTQLHLRALDDVHPVVAGGVPKIFLMGTPEQLAEHWHYLREGDGFRSTRSGETNIEVVAPGVHKASALVELGSQLGVAPSEMAAIGDNINDIEMVREVGLGVAVANARDELKHVADYVTDRTNDQCALVEFAERVLAS